MCLRQASGTAVTIGRRGGRAAIGGVAVCGCRSCPVCGPKIQAGRRDELSDAVTAARLLGYQLRFATLTLRHQLRDALGDTLEAVLRCFSALTSGRRYQELRAEYGIVGLVRVIECKHGCEHGWHPHVHVIWFFDPQSATSSPDDGVFEQLRARWSEVTRAAGYGSANAGQDWRDVTDREVDQLAGYFTKEGADPLAWELTGEETKTRGDSLTPAELLRYGAAGDEPSRRLFSEYEQAIRGRRMIAWSPGLLRQLRLSLPRENLDLAQQPELEPSECLVLIPRAVFADLVDPVGTLGMIVATVDGGVDGESLFWWLRDRGIAVEYPRNRAPWVPRYEPAPPGAPPWLAVPDPEYV